MCIRYLGNLAADCDDLQTTVNALAAWGATWRVTFEPAKSYLLHVSHHRRPWDCPLVTFQGEMVPESQCLKLLGIAFDSQMTFCQQIRQSALRATQRLGFLKKASAVLDPGCRLTVYNDFVRPVLEHGMLVWMGASQTVLAQLDAVQRRPLLRTVVPSAGLRLVGLEVTALRMTEGPRRLSHRPGATLTHAAIWCSGGVCRAGNGASL